MDADSRLVIYLRNICYLLGPVGNAVINRFDRLESFQFRVDPNNSPLTDMDVFRNKVIRFAKNHHNSYRNHIGHPARHLSFKGYTYRKDPFFVLVLECNYPQNWYSTILLNYTPTDETILWQGSKLDVKRGGARMSVETIEKCKQEMNRIDVLDALANI